MVYIHWPPRVVTAHHPHHLDGPEHLRRGSDAVQTQHIRLVCVWGGGGNSMKVYLKSVVS